MSRVGYLLNGPWWSTLFFPVKCQKYPLTILKFQKYPPLHSPSSPPHLSVKISTPSTPKPPPPAPSNPSPSPTTPLPAGHHHCSMNPIWKLLADLSSGTVAAISYFWG